MTRAVSILGRQVRLTDELRDHALVTLWIIVTFKQFRFDELILYPLALYFLWAFVRDFRAIFDIVARSLILWSYPIWYMLTVAWGTEPFLIVKSGLQLILTVVICYCAVLRLSARQIMVSVMIAAGWFGLLSLLKGTEGGVDARGVFDSKNALGGAMVLLFTASFCVSLDRRFAPLVRIVALAGIPMAILLIARAQSATAILLALAAFATILLLKGRSLLSGATLSGVVLLGLGAVATGAAIFAGSVPEADPLGQVLAYFGKDATLTGRTILWGYAWDEIARHPWLGVGQGGFWTPEDPFSAARRIYDEFYKAYYANFSFHSTYFEIGVHQGLIGVGLTIATVVWVVIRILPDALLAKDIGSIFFVCISFMTIALSFTEVTLMVPFKLDFMLLLMGALLSVKRKPGDMVQFVAFKQVSV